MKKTAFIFLMLLGLLNACKKDSNPVPLEGDLTLGVDVQSSFEQDVVQVIIDGETVINKQLQTNYVLGVCMHDGQVITTRNEGSHEIKVIVNNIITRSETFSMSNDRYIGINYNRQTNEITFIYSDQRFMYD
jgi:hypothetical protein